MLLIAMREPVRILYILPCYVARYLANTTEHTRKHRVRRPGPSWNKDYPQSECPDSGDGARILNCGCLACPTFNIEQRKTKAEEANSLSRPLPWHDVFSKGEHRNALSTIALITAGSKRSLTTHLTRQRRSFSNAGETSRAVRPYLHCNRSFALCRYGTDTFWSNHTR